jgi:hypothetical protein
MNEASSNIIKTLINVSSVVVEAMVLWSGYLVSDVILLENLFELMVNEMRAVITDHRPRYSKSRKNNLLEKSPHY